MTRALLVVGAGCLLAAGGLALLLSGPRRDDGGGINPDGGTSGEFLAQPPLDQAPFEPVAGSPSGLDFLRGYWGVDWQDREAEYRKLDTFRDTDFAKLPPPVPLEEALPHIQAKVTGRLDEDRRRVVARMYSRGGDPEEHAWIDKRFARGKVLQAHDYEAIRISTEVVQTELNDKIEVLIQAIESARDRLWSSRSYRLAPYDLAVAFPVRDESGPMISAEAGGWEGWCVGFKVLESDVPGFQDMHAEIRALREARDRRIQEYVGNL